MRQHLILGILLLTARPVLAQEPLKIVCLGDSVTKAERPGVRAEETFCAVLQKKLLAAGRKAEVPNFGIGGQTTAQGVSRLDSVLAAKPSHVVIMYGLNDSWIDQGQTAPRLTPGEYHTNLKQMVDRLKQAKVTPLLMTPNPVAPPTYTPDRNANLKKYVAMVRKLARAENVVLIDVYARYAELALEGTDLNTLFTDAMHPNPKGQALIADWLFEELHGPAKR